jgi:hypothetical protein
MKKEFNKILIKLQKGVSKEFFFLRSRSVAMDSAKKNSIYLKKISVEKFAIYLLLKMYTCIFLREIFIFTSKPKLLNNFKLHS